MDKLIAISIIETITWLGFFTAVFFAFFYYLKYRNKERMLMIEKNTDLSQLYKRSEKPFPWYILGFTMLGIGLGCAIAFLIAFLMSQDYGMDEEIAVILFTTASVILGATGMLLGHSIEQKKKILRG